MSKSLSSLSPSIEARLTAWEEIQHRITEAQAPKLRPTITLSRQFGCEGFPLAERLKALFEDASGETWNIYDKSLIEKVSEDHSISLKLLQNLGDISRFLEMLGLRPAGHVTQDEAFARISKYIVQIAQGGSAIIVGRGGAVLCGAMYNCYHFRLEAGLEWRIASIASRLELSMDDAAATVRTHASRRDDFISHCLGEDIGQSRHYDAVFNNERHNIEEVAQAILAYVRSSWREKSYFQR